MGIEVAVAVIAVAVAGATAYESSQQAKAAAKDRKQAAQVARADQAAAENQNRRQQIREERVRRAQIMQSAQNTGASESSGELGSTSALGSLISGNLAGMSRQANSADAISSLNQSAVGKDLSAANYSAVSGFASSIFGLSAGAAMQSYSAQKTPTQVKPTAPTQQNIFG